MSYAEICKVVKAIKKKYGETDPFRLCAAMGIKLIFRPLGNALGAIKGFFLESNRVCSITVNSDLPDVIQRIIVTHEIGHAVMHRHTGICAFHDMGLFNESSVTEKEANLFTADFLLKDEDVLDVLKSGTTFFAAAAELFVPVELLEFKARILKWKGYALVESPIMAQSKFLANMEIPDNADYYS